MSWFVFLSFVTILDWVSHILSFWVLSQFECVSFVTILVWFCHTLRWAWDELTVFVSVWLLLLFDLCYHYLVVTWWRPKTVKSFFFLNLKNNLKQELESQASSLKDLSFLNVGIPKYHCVTIWVSEFCPNLGF